MIVRRKDNLQCGFSNRDCGHPKVDCGQSKEGYGLSKTSLCIEDVDVYGKCRFQVGHTVRIEGNLRDSLWILRRRFSADLRQEL